jgi:hypothetical protein
MKLAVGERHIQLEVLKHLKSYKGGRDYYLVKCQCGTIKPMRCDVLDRGTTVSCGHFRNLRNMIGALKHGHARTKIFKIWTAMKQRCLNPKSTGYHRYGGRGIKVCKRWLDAFENFLADVGEIPFRGATLERIDNEGDYEPANVKWATRKEQANNVRTNKLVTWKGKTLTAAQWAERTGVKRHTIYQRLSDGRPLEEVLAGPLSRQGI